MRKQILNFHQLIQDPKADLSVAMVARFKNKLCFVIQPEKRWHQNELGQTVLPFGGIGGKVEKGEDLLSALTRECMEEIGCTYTIIPNKNTVIPIINNDKIVFTEIQDSSCNLPIFIVKNQRSEPGRKDYTYVFVYRVNLVNTEDIRPLDNPAIIMMDEDLFLKIIGNQMTLAEAQSQGAIVNTTIALPQNGLLWPTPTPRGYYIYRDTLPFSHC